MRVIKSTPLKAFWELHPDAEQPLRSWFADAERADWLSPNNLKQSYANASIIGNNRVIFNIGGNKYRLIVAVSYQARVVLIKFIGTHKEYDEVNAETIDRYVAE